MQSDLQSHAKTITVLVEEIADIKQTLAVMKVESSHRDEKLNSILSLGRTILVTVITLAIGAVATFTIKGGWIV